jgi:S-adenosyl methyltransferase
MPARSWLAADRPPAGRLPGHHGGHQPAPQAEIAAYFDGLDLVPPGLTDVWAWRPDRQWFWPPPPSARILGGVARKPAARTRQAGVC